MTSDDERRVCRLSESNLTPFNVNILVVDGDAASLDTTMEILTSLNYTGTTHSSVALEKLRNNEEYFQLIVTEVHMPNLDGFKLKEVVEKEFTIPIIMISFDNNEKIQEKALASGVVRYIIKPATLEDFKGIWQFAISGMKGKEPINTKIMRNIIEESSCGRKHHKELRSSTLKEKLVSQKSDMGKESTNTLENNGFGTEKKIKVVWTNKLQSKFMEAINIIGLKNAVPKKILQVMNVEGLTRENVASHLQKHRLFLKRVTGLFVMIVNKAKEDNDILLSKMASAYPALMLQIIQEDMEKTIKQSGRRNLNLESNSTYIAHLRFKLSWLLSNDVTNSTQHCHSKMDPHVNNVEVSSSKINNLGITTNPTTLYHSYLNVNDAYKLRSGSNLGQNIYNRPSQNSPISPSGLASNKFNNTVGLCQTSSSNLSNCNAITTFQGRNGSKGLLIPNDSSLVGVVSATNEVNSTNQSSPVSMDNNIKNIDMKELFRPQQPQHQIHSQRYHQISATMNNTIASQVTSDESFFEGLDDDSFSVENILNQVTMQLEWDYGFIESILNDMA
ncbi:putative two-component response regulator ARR21 [Abrus precatorius]|uniref:Two-component response regulator ARR21 n=1 Tax=Abrus precatorius TaxID=3816 RepID=A0A8B8JZT7_ABRPR|nr:putative two-component response regulator ARR21 [Abrus precatorius]